MTFCKITAFPNCEKVSDAARLWFLQSNHGMKMCLKLVCECTAGVSHLKMLEINRQALFRYPWTQHLVRITKFTIIHSYTHYVDIYILGLTGYSTQMCCFVNIPSILGVVVLTQTDTNRHLRGTSAHHGDRIPA